jgi:hypothetical protein
MKRLFARALITTSWLAGCTSDAYLGAAVLDGGFGRTADEPTKRDEPGIDAAVADNAAGSTLPDAAPPVIASDPHVAAESAAEPVCVQLPSFEGPPAATLYGLANVQSPWAGCYAIIDGVLSAPAFVNQTTLFDTGDGRGFTTGNFPVASQGSTYLYFDTQGGGNGQTISTPTCKPLEAGHTYSFAIELASRVGQSTQGAAFAPGRLAVYAPAVSCAPSDPPLWLSPPLTAAWTRYCITLRPTTDAGYLVLRLPADAAGRAAIYVDDMRSEPGCGAP